MKKLMCMIALAAICVGTVSAATITSGTDTTKMKTKMKHHTMKMKRKSMHGKMKMKMKDTTKM
jgi:hypothetical protein